MLRGPVLHPFLTKLLNAEGNTEEKKGYVVFKLKISTDQLRNKVVVWGGGGITPPRTPPSFRQ